MKVVGHQKIEIIIPEDEKKRIALEFISEVYGLGSYNSERTIYHGKLGIWRSVYHNDIEFCPSCTATEDHIIGLEILRKVQNYTK